MPELLPQPLLVICGWLIFLLGWLVLRWMRKRSNRGSPEPPKLLELKPKPKPKPIERANSKCDVYEPLPFDLETPMESLTDKELLALINEAALYDLDNGELITIWNERRNKK